MEAHAVTGLGPALLEGGGAVSYLGRSGDCGGGVGVFGVGGTEGRGSGRSTISLVTLSVPMSFPDPPPLPGLSGAQNMQNHSCSRSNTEHLTLS